MAYLMKLTAVGAAKIAAAMAEEGPELSLTHIALGDGNGAAVPEPTGSETALVNQVYQSAIAALYISPGDDTIFVAEMTVPGATGGWVVREIGIKDVDGELIAYGNFPATYKPIASEGSTREMVIRASVRVASASVVNLVVDTSVVLASRAWVENTITAAALIPGGLTGQLLAKASNADGDFEWIDITEGITVLVDVVQEVETLVAAQTVVNFGTVTTEGLAVYIEGVRLLKDTDYTVTSGSQITLATAYPAGTVLHAYQNDPLEAPEYLRPGLNLSDLTNAAAARANLGVASAGDLELFFMAQI